MSEVKVTEVQRIAMVASVSWPEDDVAYGVIVRGRQVGGGLQRYLTEPGLRALTMKGLVAEWREAMTGSGRVLTSRPVWFDHVTSIKLNEEGLALAVEWKLAQQRGRLTK